MSEARVVVVGGGVTGLAAAHRLHELSREGRLDASVVLLESSAAVGGHIRTETVDGHLLEAGPDSLALTKPAGLALCERIGLADDVVRFAGGRVQILHRGRLVDLPAARPGAVLRSPLFSWRGKLRLAAERFIPPRGDGADESLGAFVTRRFGREALERVAEPILASLFVADADRLSVRATLPRFLEMERRHGSVARAVAAARRRHAIEGRHGTSYANVASLRRGFGSIVDALVARLPAGSVRTGVRIERVTAPPAVARWELALAGAERLYADAVVFACPAWATAELVAGVDPRLADALERIAYAPCASVHLAYRKMDVGKWPASFGFFVPRTERSPLLAVSFVSVKLPDRVPDDRLLLRAFLGGALRPELVERDEEALARIAHEEVARLLALRGRPVLARTVRLPRAKPQYEVGFLEIRAAIESRVAAIPGLALAGGALGATGIPDCVASGERAAEAAASFVAPGRTAAATVATDA
jgi:oxygen-dependent protoporphyrinogen oxidase